MDNRVAFLQTAVPFNLLPNDVLERIAASLTETRYDKDATVYHQETSKIKSIDILVEGEYEAFFYDSNHNKHLVEIFRSGDCYGGVSELLNGKRSLCTVIVKEGTLVYTLSRKIFKEL